MQMRARAGHIRQVTNQLAECCDPGDRWLLLDQVADLLCDDPEDQALDIVARRLGTAPDDA